MKIDYGNTELNELIERLRPRLYEYLCAQGVLLDDFDLDKGENFTCINPDHEDNNPSMNFVRASDNTRVRCYSCGASADLFQAATWVEGLPNSGTEWVKENVHVLADMFEEEYVQHIPTEAEMKRARILEMLRDAADCLSGLTRQDPDKGFVHTRARGLTDKVCIEMIVGTVDYSEFIDILYRYSGGKWSQAFCQNNGVSDTWFGREFITITLVDYKGVVVGFDRRYIHFSKEEARAHKKLGKRYPKKFFLPEKSDIFDPFTFLYGLHRARSEAWRGVDIVEGFFDVLSGIQAGHKALISACGTSYIKDTHMALLKKLDFRDVCFVFDNDDAGEKAVVSTLKKFGGRNDIRMSFRKLIAPDGLVIDNLDPDLFFRMFCKTDIEPYSKIIAISSFRVDLDIQIDKGIKGEELARGSIPHIACEVDPLLRGRRCKELAEKTECPEIDIRASVDIILTGKAKNIVRDLKLELKRGDQTPGEVAAAVTRAQTKLGPLFGGSNEKVTQRAAKASFHEAVDMFYSKRGALAGYRTSIPMFDIDFGGFQKGVFLTVFGNPNSGKSALVHFLINGMLRNWKENKDLCIVFFSFDDSAAWSWAKQLAAQSGLPITWCAEPNRYILHDARLARIYQDAQAFYREMVDERLWLFGGDIGMNPGQMQKAITNAQQATGKHVLVVVDSFNKMHGEDGLEGVAKFERNANILHQMVHDGLSVITTAETKKSAQGHKPQMGDLSDTKKLSFNSNIVLGVFNPLHEFRDDSVFFWVTEDHNKPGEYRKAAILQTDIHKNRITSYKGSNVFQFHDHIGTFDQINNVHTFMEKQHLAWNTVGKNNTMGDGKKIAETAFEDINFGDF